MYAGESITEINSLLRTESTKKKKGAHTRRAITICHPEPFDRLRINSAKDLKA